MADQFSTMGTLEKITFPKVSKSDLEEFLSFARTYLGWRDLSGEIVMDVGCGIGDTSTKHITTFFPKVQKVIAIDNHCTAIAEAKAKNPHPKIEYCVADIHSSSTLTPWLDKMSKVIAINSFTFLDDMTLAFENVYKLLTPEGQAVVLFCRQSSYFDVVTEIVEQTRWKEYFKHVVALVPESHTKKLDPSHYLEIVRKVGFEVLLCHTDDKTRSCQSELECRNIVCKSVLTRHIPIAEREEFEEDIFKKFLEHNPQESIHHPKVKYQLLVVVVKKPLSSE